MTSSSFINEKVLESSSDMTENIINKARTTLRHVVYLQWGMALLCILAWHFTSLCMAIFLLVIATLGYYITSTLPNHELKYYLNVYRNSIKSSFIIMAFGVAWTFFTYSWKLYVIFRLIVWVMNVFTAVYSLHVVQNYQMVLDPSVDV